MTHKIKLFKCTATTTYDGYGDVDNRIITMLQDASGWLEIDDKQYEMLKKPQMRNQLLKINNTYDYDKNSIDFSIMAEEVNIEEINLIDELNELIAQEKDREEKNKIAQEAAKKKREAQLRKKQKNIQDKKIKEAEELLRKAGKLK